MSKKSPLQEIGLTFFETRTESDFNRVYARMKPSINYYLRDLLPAQDDREEAMANTFAKVWTKIHMYDPFWNFSTWIYRIARNEALLMHRHKRRSYSLQGMEERGIKMDQQGGVSLPQMDLIEGPECSIDSLHDRAVEEIYNLPETYRLVMEKREIEKMKYEDISSTLGWKQNTVRTRIRKGRELLRLNLIEKYPDLVKSYKTKNAEC